MAIYAELGGKRLTHPREVYEYAITNRTPTDFWKRANSYTCGRGEKPGQAWVLITRKLLDELGRNEFHTLRFVDGATIVDIENRFFGSVLGLDIKQCQADAGTQGETGRRGKQQQFAAQRSGAPSSHSQYVP